MLILYNSLTKKKELFRPLVSGRVGLYVCGMTVYDYCHVGNARIWVFFDLVARYLRAQGYDVTYVRNITDIDDKIIQRAHDSGETAAELAARYIAALHEDEQALGVLAPDAEPKATGHIADMISMIETMVAGGYAYQATNGDVYFSTKSYVDYGDLAHQNLEDLQTGARVDVVAEKHDPLDFVLWKMAKEGEPAWDSPWGSGRPGWHSECSAMATRYLGKQFDIHGGGTDLQFPHHQNELAQAKVCGCEFANFWLHVGYVQVNKKKMSKSLGNFFTVREVLQKYDAEVLRYFLLASHYRSPLDYATENLDAAHNALQRLYIAIRDLPKMQIDNDNEYAKRFVTAMDDDFNTPAAVAVLFDLAHEINRLKQLGERTEAARLASLLQHLAMPLGILQCNPQEFLQGSEQSDSEKIAALVAGRDAARKVRDWQRADEIRAELDSLGIELEDSAQGTIWRKK